MSKRPVIVSDKETKKLERIHLSSLTFREEWMQQLLEKEPQLLPVANVDAIYAPLVCIGREIETPSGFIDNLYISSKGYIVIVETKLWRNPEARREVVGQIIDYAKDVQKWSYEDLDKIFRKYSLNKHNKQQTLFEKMVECNFQTPENEANFVDITEKNIKNARFLLMIVGDGIREGVERMTDFLNSTPNMQYRLALVELEVYDLGEGQRLVVPQLTVKTSIVERGIIRVEGATSNANVTIHTQEEKPEPSQKSTTKTQVITFDEFIENVVKNIPDIKDTELSDLLVDIENLGFNISMSGAGCNISYNPNGMKEKIPLMHFQNKGTIYFTPIEIGSKLEKLGYSTKIGEQYLQEIKPLLMPKQKNTPYEYYEGVYYIEIETVVKNKEILLSALENFANKF